MVQQEFKSKSISSTIVYDYEDKLKLKGRKHDLPDKVFSHRESVLTILFENPHLRTIRHILIALFLGLYSITFAREYLENNDVTVGFRLIAACFKRFHISLIMWLFIHFLAWCIYVCFLTWSKFRIFFLTKFFTRRAYDISSSFVLLGYYLFSFSLIGHVIKIYNLPFGSAVIILMEQTRILMKVHAFVRSNVPKLLQFKEKSDKELVLPTFGYFVFFTWLPTLVYRDEYPRTAKIEWKKVSTYIFEILATVVFYSIVVERFLIHLFKDFGIKKFSPSQLFLAYLESTFPGVLILMATFYLVHHLVPNLFAELLRFGDRMFYKDWWTDTDYTAHYRKWNVFIHDWLYTYVYKDCYETLMPGSKNVAKFVAFLLSSVVHEWIFSNMLGFLFPVCFALFLGLGTTLTYIKLPQNAVSNILYLMSMAIGSGLMITGYGLEFYARWNNVPSVSERFDFYIPRCLTCHECYTW